jgi:hypothetical protein
MVELSLLESCKNCRRRVGLSFHWDITFGIEGIVWEKTVNANFSGARYGCRFQAADTWHLGCHALPQRVPKAARGCVRLCPKLKTPGAEAAMPWVLGPDPRAWGLQTRALDLQNRAPG